MHTGIFRRFDIEGVVQVKKGVLGHQDLGRNDILICSGWRNCFHITWGELLLTAICYSISIYDDA